MTRSSWRSCRCSRPRPLVCALVWPTSWRSWNGGAARGPSSRKRGDDDVPRPMRNPWRRPQGPTRRHRLTLRPCRGAAPVSSWAGIRKATPAKAVTGDGAGRVRGAGRTFAARARCEPRRRPAVRRTDQRAVARMDGGWRLGLAASHMCRRRRPTGGLSLLRARVRADGRNVRGTVPCPQGRLVPEVRKSACTPGVPRVPVRARGRAFAPVRPLSFGNRLVRCRQLVACIGLAAGASGDPESGAAAGDATALLSRRDRDRISPEEVGTACVVTNS